MFLSSGSSDIQDPAGTSASSRLPAKCRPAASPPAVSPHAAADATNSTPSASAAPSLEIAEAPISVELYSTGWQMALGRLPKIRTQRVDVGAIPIRGGRSFRISPPQLKVHSYIFPEAPAWQTQFATSSGEASKASSSADAKPRKTHTANQQSTKLKPPKDVVKLQDRLYYMLQPPLETVFSAGDVTFPFEPFPYQYKGMAFLYPRQAAVLADEMGLGKTMQAISSIRLLLHAREVESVLLICPKPLVSNWLREFRTWAPEIPIAAIEGDQAKRRWQWFHPGTPVKLANYELLLRDEELVRDPQFGFDLVVLDEAQRIKNRNSTTSRVARAIPRQRNWALTGTPIENSLEDLVGIFEFLGKGLASLTQSPAAVAEQVRDYVLRRTKDMVLTDLPPKMYRDAELELSPEQLATYRKAEDDGVMQLNAMGHEITIQHVFELVLRLKQICNFDPVTGASSKLDRLEADLHEVAASGQKAIVFSQWVQTLDRLKERLAPFGPLEYHGRVPSRKRDDILRRFKEESGHQVLLMSYGAGSVGLNLQFCRYVFLFDRWWNPAVEDQAINRAHRIGAAGSVTVTRMLTVGTIEERINQVLEEKRELFDNLFSQTGTPRSAGLTQDEVFGLFQLRTPQGPLKIPA